jgi:translation initiation factor SUI1
MSIANIQNFSNTLNLFEENKKELFEDSDKGLTKFKVHIMLQQRNSKKYITNIVEIPDIYDLPKILRFLKKTFKCNGSVLKDKNGNEFLQLTGDQRDNVRKFFIDCNVMDEDNIIIHGF